MLFRKFTLSVDETPEPAAPLKTAPTEGTPVYILGDTALAYFLALKLTAAGTRVIVMAGPKENASLATNGITLKEDYQLQKLHYRLETALWLKEDPRMLIIAAESSRVKAMLTGISKNKIKTCPVISFTRLKNKNFISDILGIQVISAYFDGWLHYQNQLVTAYGRSPSITLCCESLTETVQEFENLLTDTKISLQSGKTSSQVFWDYFCVYAPCSLLTAASGKTIFEVTKNKQLREQLTALLKEIVKLLPEQIPLYEPEELLKRIYNIPSNYVFPLSAQVRLRQTGDIDFISSVIQENAFHNKCLLPLTNQLLKNIYEQLFSPK